MLPAFDFGTQVRVLRNVRNDGTYPGQATGTLLLRRGSVGYVRDVGTYLQDQVIYSVHFLDEDRLVGCREEELQLASEPWVPSRFEVREVVRARLPLGIAGRVLVQAGAEGEVMKVLRDAADAVAYHVHFSGAGTLAVPESALDVSAADAPAADAVEERG
jgi:nitrogen fixation protein NifZ